MNINQLDRNQLQPVLIEEFHERFPFPESVYIQPSNRCNLKCRMCSIFSDDLSGRAGEPAQFLDENLFLKVAREAAGRECVLAPTGGGEGFLHPRLIEMLASAKQLGVKNLFIDTNAVLLTDELTRSLVASGIDAISISIDALTEETYRQVRCNPHFQRVMNTAETILKLRGELGRKDLKLYISFVDQDLNHHEREPFLEYWLPRADQVIINNLHNLEDGFVENLNFRPAAYPCLYPWKAIHILVDGSVVPCSHGALDRRWIMGRIQESSVEEIWHGREYATLRQNLIKDFLEGRDTCGDCNQWMCFFSRRRNEKGRVIQETPTSMSVWLEPPTLPSSPARTGIRAKLKKLFSGTK